ELVHSEIALATAEDAPAIGQRKLGGRLNVWLGQARAKADGDARVGDGRGGHHSCILRQGMLEIDFTVIAGTGGRPNSVLECKNVAVRRNAAGQAVAGAARGTIPFARTVIGIPRPVETHAGLARAQAIRTDAIVEVGPTTWRIAIKNARASKIRRKNRPE